MGNSVKSEYKGARTPVTTSISKVAYDILYRLAQDEGVSMSELLRNIIEQRAREERKSNEQIS